MKRWLLLFLFILLVSVNLVSAQQKPYTHIVINSENWRDVYSSIHFGNLLGIDSDFLVSTKHATLLVPGLSKSSQYLIISGQKPFSLNYKSLMEDSDFTVFQELKVRNANLELIEELPDINNFIIVGNTYGYDAIAVVPYAIQKKAWVFFADRTSIADIESVLNQRTVESLLIYGFVEREVRDSLSSYNPEIIDNGDRFQDNIEIVEKYLQVRPTEQITLTNGEFIEKGIMSGFDPILFTGKQNVPDQISNYLKKSDFTVGVLIGSDLVGAATNIRRSTGLSVIVKFARGARTPSGPIAPVEGLDLYYLPVPVLELSIHSAKYNRAISQLEITYKSDSNIPLFLRGTITPRDENGEGNRIGDLESVFIAPDDYKTVTYPDVQMIGDELSVDIVTLYGDAPSALERILEATLSVSLITVIDSCDISIESVTYSKSKNRFEFPIENVGSVDCYVDIELPKFIIDNRQTPLGTIGSTLVSAGKTKKAFIDQELNDDDLVKNSLVDLIAYYGEREDSLVKVFQGKFPLLIRSVEFGTVVLVTILLILFILIFIILWRRRKKKKDGW